MITVLLVVIPRGTGGITTVTGSKVSLGDVNSPTTEIVCTGFVSEFNSRGSLVL